MSIDSADDLHDQLRNVKGIRKRAIEGIELCKKEDTNIIINNIISKYNMDKIEGLVKLAKKLDVKISFQPMEVFKNCNEDLKATDEELKHVFRNILKYKEKDYPIVNSTGYLRYIADKYKFKCHMPKLTIVVDANGEVSSCSNLNKKIWGNVKDLKITDLYKKDEFIEFCKKVENCNVCNYSVVFQSSHAYSFSYKYLF